MDALDAITYMEVDAGKSDSQLSRDIGKSRNYMSVIRAKKCDIRTSSLARIAAALGWSLVLKRGDVEIKVTPRS